MNTIVLEIVEHSSASGMAMYSDCRYTFHTELVHGCSAIVIACLSMFCQFISYLGCLLRPDDLGKDVSSLCFRVFLSILIVHPKGGKPGGARVVTSYIGVVPGYAGSFRYDGVPRIEWGRPRVLTAPFDLLRNCFMVSVVPDIWVPCRSSRKDVRDRMYSSVGHSPRYP